MEAHVTDLTQLDRVTSAFTKLRRLDLRRLRQRIRNVTWEGKPVSLQELWTADSTDFGMLDLLGFIQIACDDQHSIDPTRTEILEWTSSERPGTRIRARVPQILFLPRTTSRPAGRKPR
jgi:hypothetical protein